MNKFSTFNGTNYFSSGISQSYLVFVPAKKYVKYFIGTTRIDSWKTNGMPEKNMKNITKPESNFCTNFCRSSFIIRHKF